MAGRPGDQGSLRLTTFFAPKKSKVSPGQQSSQDKGNGKSKEMVEPLKQPIVVIEQGKSKVDLGQQSIQDKGTGTEMVEPVKEPIVMVIDDEEADAQARQRRARLRPRCTSASARWSLLNRMTCASMCLTLSLPLPLSRFICQKLNLLHLLQQEVMLRFCDGILYCEDLHSIIPCPHAQHAHVRRMN